MGIRITGTFKSPATAPVGPDLEREYRVDIYDADYSGSSTEIILLSCEVLWESEKGDDRHAPIIGSRASVSVNVPATDSTLTTFIEDLAYAEDGRFLMEITRDAGITTIWRGIVKPDQSAEDDIDPFPFKISAVCGLSSLKDKPFLSGGAYYHGRHRFTEILIVAMDVMAHVPTFWTGSDVFLRTSVDWWSSAMSSGANDDALYQSGVDAYVFHKANSDGPIEDTVISCYDVLSEIMRTFGCRIYQSEGVWRIEQIPYRTAEYYYTRDYDVTGAFISSTYNTGVNTINQTFAGAKLTLVNYDFLPILKKVRVFYNARKRRNLVSGEFINSDNDAVIFDQYIDSNSGTAVVRIRGVVSYSIRNDAYGGSSADKFFIVPKFQLKIGSSYLSRNYTISNFTANLGTATWNLSSASRVYLPYLVGTIPAIGTTVTGYYSFEILTDGLLYDGDENLITWDVHELKKWNGTTIPNISLPTNWDLYGLYIDIFDDGAVTEPEEQVVFEAVNPSEASEKYDVHLRVGNSDDDYGNNAGRIFYKSGATWTAADVWGQGVDPRTSHICDVLALNILNGQGSPRRRMNGSFYGNFRNYRLMSTSDGRKWMFTRLNWDLTQNTMNGSWVELYYGADGVSSTPVKIKGVKGNIGFPAIPDPSNPNGLSNGYPGFSINPSPAVLAPVSYNSLATQILTGATVTSVPVKTASAGNEFLAGDEVGLVDPYTGQFQYFTIATAPALGDTSLSVTSETALYDFPEDSYLVISQKPYAFTPGNWYTYKGTVSSNKVIVSGFTLPANDDACFCIVRRQIYQSPDDFTINYGDNSVNFLSGLGLNGQVAYVKAYA